MRWLLGSNNLHATFSSEKRETVNLSVKCNVQKKTRTEVRLHSMFCDMVTLSRNKPKIPQAAKRVSAEAIINGSAKQSYAFCKCKQPRRCGIFLPISLCVFLSLTCGCILKTIISRKVKQIFKIVFLELFFFRSRLYPARKIPIVCWHFSNRFLADFR